MTALSRRCVCCVGERTETVAVELLGLQLGDGVASSIALRAMPGPIIVPQRPVPRDCTKPVQCWAHSKAGKRCECSVVRPPADATPSIRNSLPVPLCRTHMSAGDGALKVVKHPTFGKILVARCDLPKGYRTVYWGHRKQCGYATDNDGNVVEDRAVSFAPSGSHSALSSA